MKQGYSNFMKAIYTPDEVQVGQRNPFWEALPRYSRSEIHEQLSDSSRFFQVAWRSASKEFRIENMQFMRDHFFVPCPRHVDLYVSFRQLIRSRYLSMGYQDHKYFHPNSPGFNGRKTARNLGMFGTAGVGKSTAGELLCSQIPSVIVHERFEEQPVTLKQVTCLRIVCGATGGGKTLNNEIASAFNRVADGAYSETAGGSLAQSQTQQLLKSGAVAIILIDEIQNILTQGPHKQDTLATLTKINEKYGVPLILIGTEEAKKVIESVGHSARRAAGFKKWRAMRKDGEWEEWIPKVLNLHVTQEPISLELWGELIFNYSGGIADDAVGLFLKAQENALRNNREDVREIDFKNAMEDSYLREKTLKEHRKRLSDLNSGGESTPSKEESEISEETTDLSGMVDPETDQDEKG